MANTLKIKRGLAASIPQGQLSEPLFTTDTYDLYIGKGAGGNQRIQNYIASGTSSQFLKGDGSLDSTTYQATSEKGQNNGYASLDAGGKVPVSELPNSIIEYKGTWNASTNTPTLADGTGNAGDVYIVSVGGTQNLGSGSITFAAGDWVMYNGTIWEKSINSNAVVSVNSQTGVVVLYTDDISEDGSPTNLWYTDARARLALSATSPVQYNNSTGVISILDASGSQSGVVTTGTQTFAGAKTFSSDLTINGVTAGRGGGGESTSTAFGYQALYSNTYNATSNANTAIGYRALYSTVSASGEGGTNTAVGADTLYANTTGDNNTAIGVNAGRYLTTGSANTLIGMASFFLSTTGQGNTAVGYGAGQSNTSGDFNTYVGYAAAQNYTGGSNNTIIGRFAGSATSISGNVIIADGSGNVRFQHDGTNGKLPFLTSNGFVKTSNSDGTLSVDTNTYLTTSSASSTYLPLTGGTLTGALSGTSATFSSSVSINSSAAANYDLNIYNTIPRIQLQNPTSGTTTSDGLHIYQSGSDSYFINKESANMYLGTSNGINLTISSTGAATFSSSVTTNGTYFVQNTDYNTGTATGTNFRILLNASSGNTYARLQTYTDGGGTYGNIVLNALGGNVGIGTTAPTDSIIGSGTFLDIASTGGGALKLHYTNATAYGEFSFYKGSNGSYIDSAGAATLANNDLIFRTGGTASNYSVTERMRITSGGVLAVNTTYSTYGIISVKSKGTNSYDGINVYDTSTNQFIGLTHTGSLAILSSDYVTSSPFTPLAFYTGGSERMRITSGGIAVIGNNPTVSAGLAAGGLHVSDRIAIASGSVGTPSIHYATDTNTGIYFPAADTLGIVTGGVDAMRITSGGDTYLGTTTTDKNSRLVSYGNSTTSSSFALRCYSSGSDVLFGVRNDGLINTGLFTNSPYNFSITGRDVYVNSNGELGYLSSVRESKININNIENVDWLLYLNPVSFNKRKRDEEGKFTDEFYNELDFGLIAEEAELVNDQICFYDETEKGKIIRGVSYTKLITPMLKIIQQQQAQIEELKLKLS